MESLINESLMDICKDKLFKIAETLKIDDNDWRNDANCYRREKAKTELECLLFKKVFDDIYQEFRNKGRESSDDIWNLMSMVVDLVEDFNETIETAEENIEKKKSEKKEAK